MKKPALIVLLLANVLLHIQVHADTTAVPQHPPGDFVNLGMHRLYFDCRGFKSPTVLIDTGLGESSASWLPILEALENHTRICVYDRAGYGWSDTGPGSRTTAQISHELHAMLQLANIPGPYVLVGHSFGGFTARYFASKYANETAGVVLVESSHPDQVWKLSRLDNISTGRKPALTRNEPPTDNLSDMQKQWRVLNTRRKAIFAQMDEMKHFSESAEQVKNAGPFPAVPLAVLSRGRILLPTVDGVSLENEWLEMQKQLAQLSPESWHVIISKSGHSVYADAPEVIVENIMKVIVRARLKMSEAGEASGVISPAPAK